MTIFVWEFMFTGLMHQTAEMIEQQRLLNAIADLVNKGQLRTIMNEVIRSINAAHLTTHLSMHKIGLSHKPKEKHQTHISLGENVLD